MLSPQLSAWGTAIVQYAKKLDSKFLVAYQHLPPLDPDNPASDLVLDADLPTAILVRKSYPKIYEYMKQQQSLWSQRKAIHRGLVIIGQPGIGKTAFLFYALVRALKDGIPVDWCQSAVDTEWIQFNGDKIDSITDHRERRLALYDQTPPVLSSEANYTVQSTSPLRKRYKDWTKQRRARFWIMNNWMEKEIDVEMKYRGIDIANPADTTWYGMFSPKEAFEIIGPSARRCFTPTRRTKNAISAFTLEQDVKFLFNHPHTLNLVTNLLGNPVPTAYKSPNGFHRTFYVRNVADKLQPVENEGLSYKPGTQAQRDMLRAVILKKKLRLDLNTASIFPSNRAVGGYIFESFVLQTLKHDSNPFELHTGPSSSSSSTLINSPKTILDFDPKQTKTFDLAVDTIYSPTISNFPSLDFFFVTDVNNEHGKHHVVMFQTTISNKQSDKGIEQVITYVQSQPTLATRLGKLYFAFVVPDGSIGAKLARERSTGTDCTMTILGLTVNVGYMMVKVEDDIADILNDISLSVYENNEEEEEEEGRMDVES